MHIEDVRTWRILIVDDEPDNLEVVAESLEFFGASVKIAHNGKEALALLPSFAPNLILMDLSMPVMDGWQTRQQIHLISAELPIIALSAHAMAGDSERALAAGFDGYMTKPVSIPTLVSDLQTILKGT